MKITDIKQQVKRQDRYSIFVNGKFVFSLSENELMNAGIKIGREYDDEQLQELKSKAVIDKAYMRSLDLLARRARSEWEIRDYLKRKEISAEAADIVVAKLKDRSYLDDLQFCLSWINSRRELRNSSNRRIKLELRQKRVDENTIDEAFSSLPNQDKENLRLVIEKKRRQSKYQDNQKLMAYLSRQGFSYDDIRDVLESLAGR